MVISLERDADLHMAQLMPLPLTVSCFCKIHIGFIFLLPRHPGGPRQRAAKRVCVCVCVCVCVPQLLQIVYVTRFCHVYCSLHRVTTYRPDGHETTCPRSSLPLLQVSVAEWLARLTVVWKNPGSNHTAGSCVYRDSRCDIQPWARAAHLYCSAYVDSAFHPPWDGKIMSIILSAE